MANFTNVFPEFLRNMIRVGEAPERSTASWTRWRTSTKRGQDQPASQFRDDLSDDLGFLRSASGAADDHGAADVLSCCRIWEGEIRYHMGDDSVSKLHGGHLVYIVCSVVFSPVSLLCPHGRRAQALRRFQDLFPLTKGITVKVITSRFARSWAFAQVRHHIINAMNFMSTLIATGRGGKFAQSSDEVSRAGAFPFRSRSSESSRPSDHMFPWASGGRARPDGHQHSGFFTTRSKTGGPDVIVHRAGHDHRLAVVMA
jgi:hypothetical protein